MPDIIVNVTYGSLHKHLSPFLAYFSRHRSDQYVKALLHFYRTTLKERREDVLLSSRELLQVYLILQQQMEDQETKFGQHSQQLFSYLKNEFDAKDEQILFILKKLLNLGLFVADENNSTSAEQKISESAIEYSEDIFDAMMTHEKISDLLMLISALIIYREGFWSDQEFKIILKEISRINNPIQLWRKMLDDSSCARDFSWWVEVLSVKKPEFELSDAEDRESVDLFEQSPEARPAESPKAKTPFDTANGLYPMQSLMSMFNASTHSVLSSHRLSPDAMENQTQLPRLGVYGMYPAYIGLFQYNKAYLATLKRHVEAHREGIATPSV